MSDVSRVDSFLHKAMNGKEHHQLWSFVRKLLLLSHGLATVDPVNKEAEVCNMIEETVVKHRGNRSNTDLQCSFS